MLYTIKKTSEYDEWLLTQSEKTKVQIAKRLANIELYGHFGTIKDVHDYVWELKWQNGRRVYEELKWSKIRHLTSEENPQQVRGVVK